MNSRTATAGQAALRLASTLPGAVRVSGACPGMPGAPAAWAVWTCAVISGMRLAGKARVGV